MRHSLFLALALSCAGAAVAQTTSPPTGGPATAAPPPSSVPAPATRPPGTTSAPPPPAVLQPRTETRPSQDAAPPSAGKRPPVSGAGSSERSRETKTGKNPGSETYTSCLNMWERTTHMSKQEWSRACRRVENRLQNLQLSEDLDRLKTGTAATRRR